MISAASSVSVYLHIFIWPKWILPNVFIKSLFSRFGDFRIFFFNKWLCDIKKKECLQDPNKVSESSSHSRALYYVSPCGRFSVLLFPQETWKSCSTQEEAHKCLHAARSIPCTWMIQQIIGNNGELRPCRPTGSKESFLSSPACDE